MLTPWLLVAGLFIPLRWLERWLHQRVFKVGWLVTKNMQTTTVLYYTFFLPGVFVNQFIFWLAAGMLNVRADRALAWPELQAIGQLKLGFVKLGKGTGRLKLAIISAAPLVGGIVAVWVITNSILNVQPGLAMMSSGDLDAVTAGLGRLTSAPDFWLWVWIAFTIGNTMMPDSKDLRGGWILLAAIAVLVVGFFFVGAGDNVLRILTGPIANSLNILSGTFIVIIVIDLVMVGALAAIENLIERTTGDSATFKDGKLIAMRREEIAKLRETERAKQARQTTRQAAAPSGPPSVYKLQFTIPGAPGKEPVVSGEPIFVRRDESAVLPPPGSTPAAAPTRPPLSAPLGSGSPLGQPPPGDDRAGPAMITGTAVVKPAPPVEDDEDRDEDDLEDDEANDEDEEVEDEEEDEEEI